MRAKPKVLILTSTLEFGGSETKMVRIGNELARDGYEVRIAYFNPPDSLLSKVASNVLVSHLERRGKYSITSLRKLRKILTEARQIILTVNFYPLLYAVPAVAWSAGGHRLVSLVNTTEFVGSQKAFGYLYAPFLRRCHHIVFGCVAQQAMWTRRYRLFNNSSYIYNGVDIEHYSTAAAPDERSTFRRRHGIAPNEFVIGGVGRLAPEKNFGLLIDAVSKLNESGRRASLVIVGEGNDKGHLSDLARERNLSSRVVFAGATPDVRSALSAMDIFVLPSKAVETFSNAALEAMSMSRPVILSDIGGASEMILHGRDGYLFDNGDLTTLTKQLIHLYDYPALRARIGSAARTRVLEDFQFGRMVESYAGLIDAEAAVT